MIFIVIVIAYIILFPLGYGCMRWRDKIREVKHKTEDNSFLIATLCPPFAIMYGLTEVFLTKKGILGPYEEREYQGWY